MVEKIKFGNLQSDQCIGIQMGLTVPFAVTMPCGIEYVFSSIKVLPRETAHCLCGNKGHIVVEWKDNER